MAVDHSFNKVPWYLLFGVTVTFNSAGVAAKVRCLDTPILCEETALFAFSGLNFGIV